MSNSCVTLETFLNTLPEFKTFGGPASGTILFDSAPAPGDTITIGSGLITGAAGPRVPGTDTWSTDGTALQQAQDLLEALQDPANSFFSYLIPEIETPGLAKVTVTTIATGPDADLPWSTSNATDIILDPLTALSGGATLVEFFLHCACKMINLGCWGNKASCAHIYLTAHMLTVGSGGAAGITTSKTIDKISVGYAVTTFDSSDAAFASTPWGQLYLAMKQTLFVLPWWGEDCPPHGDVGEIQGHHERQGTRRPQEEVGQVGIPVSGGRLSR